MDRNEPVLCRLAAGELTLPLFSDFDRYQEVRQCWRKEQGKWVVKEIAFLEQWSETDYRELCQSLRDTLSGNGTVWGLFVQEKLKGFCAVEGKLLGSCHQYADLSQLYVSADCRGHGFGRLLFQKAVGTGKCYQAKALYISTHSSVESQAFYHRMGCVEAEEADDRHVAAEPCDCQLEYRIVTESSQKEHEAGVC